MLSYWQSSIETENETLVCAECGVVFQIKDGIPILLIDEVILPDGINSISELKCRKTKYDS